MSGTHAIQTTSEAKWVIVLRVLAGAPLVVFGVMHLAGVAPMQPLVEAAGMPAPGVMAVLAPLMQVLGGLLLVFGAFTRLGALLAIGVMAGAVYTHIRIPNDQWPMPTEADPNAVGAEPIALMYIAIAIIVFSAVMLFVGAGKWSLDSKMASGTPGGLSPREPAGDYPQS